MKKAETELFSFLQNPDVQEIKTHSTLLLSKAASKTGITALLDAGADVAAVDKYVMATLAAALHMKVSCRVRRFLHTPLHIFAERGIANDVQALLNARADVHSKNR
jgi:hypothetical protein